MKYFFLASMIMPGLLWTQKPVPFTYKGYGNVANYFTTSREMNAFFEFAGGQTIAEVGAMDGQNIVGFSLLTNNTVFYAQDISASTLTIKRFGKLQKAMEKYGNSTRGNTFHLCIGNEKQSLLPEGVLDKIILVSTFHEFTYIDDMLKDLYTKLKPGGKLYILDTPCLGKGHRNYTRTQVLGYLEAHHLFPDSSGTSITPDTEDTYRMVFKKSE